MRLVLVLAADFDAAREVVAQRHQADVAGHGFVDGDLHVLRARLGRRDDGPQRLVQRPPLLLQLARRVPQVVRVQAKGGEFEVLAIESLIAASDFTKPAWPWPSCAMLVWIGISRLLLHLQRQQGLGDLLGEHPQLARGIDPAGIALELGGSEEVEHQDAQVQHDESRIANSRSRYFPIPMVLFMSRSHRVTSMVRSMQSLIDVTHMTAHRDPDLKGRQLRVVNRQVTLVVGPSGQGLPAIGSLAARGEAALQKTG